MLRGLRYEGRRAETRSLINHNNNNGAKGKTKQKTKSNETNNIFYVGNES